MSLEPDFNSENLYTVLGLTRTAQLNEISKAVRKLSLKYHPDKDPSEEAKVIFNRVQHAKVILTDSEKRRGFDQEFFPSPVDAREDERIQSIITDLQKYIETQKGFFRKNLIAPHRIKAATWCLKLLQNQLAFDLVNEQKHISYLRDSERLQFIWIEAEQALDLPCERVRIRKQAVITNIQEQFRSVRNQLPEYLDQIDGLNADTETFDSLNTLKDKISNSLVELINTAEKHIKNHRVITSVCSYERFPKPLEACSFDGYVNHIQALDTYYKRLIKHYRQATPYSENREFSQNITNLDPSLPCNSKIERLLDLIRAFRRHFFSTKTADIANDYFYITKKHIEEPEDLNDLDAIIAAARSEIDAICVQKSTRLYRNPYIKEREKHYLASSGYYELTRLEIVCEYRKTLANLREMYDQDQDALSRLHDYEHTIVFYSSLNAVVDETYDYFNSYCETLVLLQSLSKFQMGESDTKYIEFHTRSLEEINQTFKDFTQGAVNSTQIEACKTKLIHLHQDLGATIPYIQNVIHGFNSKRWSSFRAGAKARRIHDAACEIEFEKRGLDSFTKPPQPSESKETLLNALTYPRFGMFSSAERTKSSDEFQEHLQTLSASQLIS
jgi:curved DNA-binding protein CbpA